MHVCKIQKPALRVFLLGGVVALTALAAFPGLALSQDIPAPALALENVPPPSVAPSEPGTVAQYRVARPSVSLLTPEFINRMRAMGQEDVFQHVIKAYNYVTRDYTDADTARMDSEWAAQREQESQPLIARITGNPLSARLSQLQADSLGVIAEILVMDGRGFNAAISSVPSDYWQGDEDKYSKTYLVGPDAYFIDEPEFDAKNGIWIVQLDLSIADAENPSRAIGAMTIDVNLTELKRRSDLGI